MSNELNNIFHISVKRQDGQQRKTKYLHALKCVLQLYVRGEFQINVSDTAHFSRVERLKKGRNCKVQTEEKAEFNRSHGDCAEKQLVFLFSKLYGDNKRLKVPTCLLLFFRFIIHRRLAYECRL